MEYDFYIMVPKGMKPPESIPDAEVVNKEHVMGDWWKITLRLDKEKFDAVVDWLRSEGYRLAKSANY